MPGTFDFFKQCSNIVKFQPGRWAKVMRPHLELARGLGVLLGVEPGAEQIIYDLLKTGFGAAADLPVDCRGDVRFEGEGGAHGKTIGVRHHDVNR